MVHMGVFNREGIEKWDKIESKVKSYDGSELIGHIYNDILELPVIDEEAEYSAIFGEDTVTVLKSEWLIIDRMECERFTHISNGKVMDSADEKIDFGIYGNKRGDMTGYSLPPDILGEEWIKQNGAVIIKANRQEEKLRILKERFDGYDMNKLGKGLELCK